MFDRRLAKAVKKYGGGANIPPEVVGELLGDTGGDYGLILAVHIGRVCKHLDIEPSDTNFLVKVGWLYNGNVPTIEDRIYALGLLDELAENPGAYAYALVLRELIACGDTSYNKIREHFKTHEEYTDFMRLCGRE
jgi:hypothetical protein